MRSRLHAEARRKGYARTTACGSKMQKLCMHGCMRKGGARARCRSCTGERAEGRGEEARDAEARDRAGLVRVRGGGKGRGSARAWDAVRAGCSRCGMESWVMSWATRAREGRKRVGASPGKCAPGGFRGRRKRTVVERRRGEEAHGGAEESQRRGRGRREQEENLGERYHVER